jgi:hypothetical protein
MKKDANLNTALGALLLILLAVLVLLALRRGLAPDEKDVVKVQREVIRDSHSRVAVVAFVALLAYVMWVVLSARREEAKVTPPASQPSANQQDRALPAG